MVHKLVSTLTLEQAERIADAALAHGSQLALLPLTIVILDAGGHLVLAKRQDGSGIVRFDIALAKAWGALGMGMDSAVIGEKLSGNPPFLNAVVAASGGRLAPNPGGILILDDNQYAIGAVGISGDVGGNDELCARIGLRAAGLRDTTV